MSHTLLPVRCLLDTPSTCAWSPHGRKHFPCKGITRADTRHPNPAKYLEGFSEAAIRALEVATVHHATFQLGVASQGKTEYLRDIGAPIGWDDGAEATLSFVECSGGSRAGRAFHGRPMAATNPTARRLQRGAP